MRYRRWQNVTLLLLKKKEKKEKKAFVIGMMYGIVHGER